VIGNLKVLEKEKILAKAIFVVLIYSLLDESGSNPDESGSNLSFQKPLFFLLDI